MDKALGLVLLTENAIRLPAERPANAEAPSRNTREAEAEECRLAGILWKFVQARRGTPSGR